LSATCDEIHLLKEGEIIRSVEKPEFEILENEMKAIIMENRIDRLGLK
jgi:ABC-2 type transport system ATP-binding protein